VFSCKFGDEKFLEVIGDGIDVLCHHGSDVANYKSNSFNICEALRNNTNNIQHVFDNLRKSNCSTVIYTGSIFENGEGSGSLPLRAFSHYGLSKSFTYETLKYFCEIDNIKIGKFVIPNPFGPYEEFRFTSFLIQNWFKGNVPQIKTPDYVRDNIHVDLLAKAYTEFVNKVFTNTDKIQKINPSCYTETQGNFAKRFAYEMEKRINIPCNFESLQQTDFSEPLKRVNTENIMKSYNWNENSAWDKLAEYYLKEYRK
jgi:nucleoside-diphosphate-sugar epimerase